MHSQDITIASDPGAEGTQYGTGTHVNIVSEMVTFTSWWQFQVGPTTHWRTRWDFIHPALAHELTVNLNGVLRARGTPTKYQEVCGVKREGN